MRLFMNLLNYLKFLKSCAILLLNCKIDIKEDWCRWATGNRSPMPQGGSRTEAPHFAALALLWMFARVPRGT